MTPTPKPAWEERFDEKFTEGCFGFTAAEEHLADIKAFIQETLASQRDELRKKLMSDVRIGNIDLSNPHSWEKGYNDCLIKALASLDYPDNPTN